MNSIPPAVCMHASVAANRFCFLPLPVRLGTRGRLPASHLSRLSTNFLSLSPVTDTTPQWMRARVALCVAGLLEEWCRQPVDRYNVLTCASKPAPTCGLRFHCHPLSTPSKHPPLPPGPSNPPPLLHATQLLKPSSRLANVSGLREGPC